MVSEKHPRERERSHDDGVECVAENVHGVSFPDGSRSIVNFGEETFHSGGNRCRGCGFCIALNFGIVFLPHSYNMAREV
jgi:hypothetical protein